MLVFLKIWYALFSWNTLFEICHFALFPAKFYSRNTDFSSRKSGEQGDTCFLSRGTFEWGLEIFKVVDTKEDVMRFFKETFVGTQKVHLSREWSPKSICFVIRFSARISLNLCRMLELHKCFTAKILRANYKTLGLEVSMHNYGKELS